MWIKLQCWRLFVVPRALSFGTSLASKVYGMHVHYISRVSYTLIFQGKSLPLLLYSRTASVGDNHHRLCRDQTSKGRRVERRRRRPHKLSQATRGTSEARRSHRPWRSRSLLPRVKRDRNRHNHREKLWPPYVARGKKWPPLGEGVCWIPGDDHL